jgi:hypoxanthine phosphoribosyltransferase
MKSYDYAHRSGCRKVSWDDFAHLSAQLAGLLTPFHPQVIVGIARAGLFPATLVACSLRLELFPIRLKRRVNDRVVYDQPVWRVPIPPEVNGKVIAIIDEIADSGQTLSMAAGKACELGALQVVTASLVSHSWANPAPQACCLVTDEFVIFPWDQQVLEGGKWVPHPEVLAGLKAQGRHSPS